MSVKIGLILLLAAGVAACTDSVLDPADLAKKDGPAGSTSDLIFYNEEVVNFGIGSYRSVHSVSTATGSLNTVSTQGFISSPPVGDQLLYIDDSMPGQCSLYLCDQAGNNKQFILEDSIIDAAVLSPDGQTIAYCVTYEDPYFMSFSRIKLVSTLNPSAGTVIAEDGDPSVIPTFSPDGSSLAYAQLVPSGNDMLAVYSLGMRSTTYLNAGLNSLGIDLEFDWTSDSKKLLCITDQYGSPEIVLLDLYGTMTRLNFPAGGLPIFPVMSAGNKIAAVSFNLISNTSEIYVYNGSGWDNITNSPNATEVLPHFSADGTKLVYSCITGPVDPFSQLNTLPVSDLKLYENGASRTLTSGLIVRPLFGR